MKYSKTFLTAVLAGFLIGIGGMIYLSVDNKIVGSALFSIGLFVVLTYNLSLFTGKICYVLVRERKRNIINVIITWCGNFLGTMILSLIILNTRSGSGIKDKALAVCQIKNTDSYLSLFWLGFLCNIFIFLAVDEFKKNEHVLGKYLAIFLCVMGFILSGTEHCVADMFYYNVAQFYSVDMVMRLLIITLGNTIGGICSNFFAQKIA
ncbi:Formate/nitrite transporter FocA, FNT family [Pseudobutyrivibrio sp. ACV-2]|uniref:formate/nitrite transporter family protein n=1 Tax=Pseudobutyrivibrio sp. ACV-2 TaxID=1520801 RepID=UPI00089B0EF2|nr:formate/nitrite transporter family protein [Pseudobutyrivibrio sp. ACV-2]SEA82540.1 Formate/nitrite transporter FocA, FNT family [Pseudobutyrivibrio sp. ACV-2]